MNSAGNIWQANTSAFAIHETTYAGDTLRTIQLDRDAPKLEGRERDSIAAAAGIATRRLPERKHAIETIRTSPDGWVWIETERGATRAWEVFDERGYYMGRVVPPVPIEKQPFPFFRSRDGDRRDSGRVRHALRGPGGDRSGGIGAPRRIPSRQPDLSTAIDILSTAHYNPRHLRPNQERI